METPQLPLKGTISGRMGQNGRIVIPAEIRKAMNLQEGDAIAFRYDENGLHIQTPMQALKELQKMLSASKKPGESVVDEFLRDRRKIWGEE